MPKNARMGLLRQHRVRGKAPDQELDLDPALPLPPCVIVDKSLPELRPQLLFLPNLGKSS